MSDNNKTSIDEKFLGFGDLFGLKFNDGLVFAQVDGVETNKYQPYTQIGEIAADGTSGFQRLNDPDGDDILYIDDAEQKVLHASIGQTPQQIRRYTNYPESENRLRTPPNLSAPRPTQLDNYGYIDGQDSPYGEPTNAQQLLIPPLLHLDFAFSNPDQNTAHEPILNIKFREYNITTLDPRKNKNSVKRVISPGSPIPVYPIGSLDSQANMPNDLKRSWEVNPMSKQEVMGVVNNGR